MKVIRIEEIDSTNSYAKSHIDNFADRTVIHARRQTNGRGRFNRKWVDLGEGNLFFSLVLKPSASMNPVFTNITQYASVILCDVLENYGVNAKIKWPNDVMIDGRRKISGILSETVMDGSILKGIVLGIGVNLNASQSDVSDIPDRVAASLNLEIGKSVNMDVFLDEFVNKFFENYDEFLEKGFEFIKRDYINKNCFLDKDLKVQVLNELKNGIAKGVNDNGELLLQDADNKELVLSMGDIL